jgi:hypothetical protein
MFRDARALDRQRTASSFNQAMRRYAAGTERWYTGTVDSVDTRLANCERLLHYASATVARLPISDSGHYIQAAERLDSDRRSLIALREDLLTGAAGREDVTGPPGWRSARVPDAYDTIPELNTGPTGQEPKPAPTGTKFDPRALKEINKGADPEQGYQHRTQQTHDDISQRYPDLAGPNLPDDPEDIANRQELGHDPAWATEMQQNLQQLKMQEMQRAHQREREMEQQRDHPSGHAERWRADQPYATSFDTHATPGQMSLFNDSSDQDLPKLAGTDRRWVTLEAAKFVAANADCLDDSHELAVRAANHADIQTSTFPRARSAAISEAFVGRVTDLGRQSYRPPVRTAAAFQDFDPQALFL